MTSSYQNDFFRVYRSRLSTVLAVRAHRQRLGIRIIGRAILAKKLWPGTSASDTRSRSARGARDRRVRDEIRSPSRTIRARIVRISTGPLLVLTRRVQRGPLGGATSTLRLRCSHVADLDSCVRAFARNPHAVPFKLGPLDDEFMHPRLASSRGSGGVGLRSPSWPPLGRPRGIFFSVLSYSRLAALSALSLRAALGAPSAPVWTPRLSETRWRC